ncbi:SDR family oxidoreductase [Kribbella sp. NBC_00889]|uniref:SDR family oxidoreductase n=1 Tax=Kribbella sp. NBC_00889 TaxID=2975974 RepID=UPI003865C0B4|nr:NAD(P)H-binding protein [Kribbella sp. NBC_00889]
MMLVVGGTGELGGRVVRLLVGAGQEVVCLVRPQSDGSRLEEAGAKVVRGDLTDSASLQKACEGVSTVVATATAIARLLARVPGPSLHEVDEVGMVALVDAAQAAGVERFVYISYAGVEAGLGLPLERAKLAVEQRLKASSMRAVIVRPDAFHEIHLAPPGRFDIANGKVSTIGKGDAKQRWVSTDDVAALVAAVAVEPDPPELIEFGGPEALSRNEAVAIAEQFTGRRLKVQHMPRPVVRVMVRILSRTNDGMASALGVGLLQDLHDAPWDDEPLRSRGITPRSTTDYLRDCST